MNSTPTPAKMLHPEPKRVPRTTLETISLAAGRSPSIKLCIQHIAFLEQTIKNMDVLHKNAMSGKEVIWNPLEVAFGRNSIVTPNEGDVNRS